jgi:GTP-binding protein HflX
LERDDQGRVRRVWVSARTGAGIDLLLDALSEHFLGERLHRWIFVGPAEGALRAWFFTHAQVLTDRTTEEGGWEMEVIVPSVDLDRLLSKDRSLTERFAPMPVGKAVANG